MGYFMINSAAGKDGAIRGYVRHDADRLAMLGANPSLYALFGKAYLAITFDYAVTGQRYQGKVRVVQPVPERSGNDAFRVREAEQFAQARRHDWRLRITDE